MTAHPRPWDRRAPLRPLVVVFFAGVVLGLILGAFVVKASSSASSEQDGGRAAVAQRADPVSFIDGGALPADERISPIARGKISLTSLEATQAASDRTGKWTVRDDPPATPASITDIIRAAALEFSQSPDEMIAVAKCESSLNPAAIGDHGAAVGLYQFHIWRWSLNAPHLGYTDDLRADPVAASRVAAYAFATGQRAAWTCRG